MAIPFKMNFKCPLATSNEMVDGQFHCQQCNKTVHDATDWSTAEIAFRLKQAGNSLCVTLRPEQLDDSLEAAIVRAVPRRLRFWELFALGLFFTFGLANAAMSQTQAQMDSINIARYYADATDRCNGRRGWDHVEPYGGSIAPHNYDSDWFSVGKLKRRIGEDGQDIILVTQPVFFPRDVAVINDKTVIPGMPSFDVSPQDALFGTMNMLLNFPDKVVVILGYADPDERGDLQALSLQRAQNVAEHLKYWGIQNKLVVKGLADSQPNDEPNYKNFSGREQRVRIVLVDPQEE